MKGICFALKRDLSMATLPPVRGGKFRTHKHQPVQRSMSQSGVNDMLWSIFDE